jgi:hypothetical protein
MQKDKQFRVSGRWALASDGIQWVIQRQNGPNSWQAVKFIHTGKAWLEYRLRQLAPAEDVERLLEGLPNTFGQWAAARASHDMADSPGHPPATGLPEVA